MKFHRSWPSPAKNFWLPLEKSSIDPYGKNPSNAHALVTVMENLFVLEVAKL